MFLRPNMYTSYEQESEILPTYTKKVMAAIGILVLFLLPFDVPIISGPTDIPVLRSIPRETLDENSKVTWGKLATHAKQQIDSGVIELSD